VVFAIQPDGFVEAHVQVFYEGAPNDFAWLIPIPTQPEVFLSTGELFTRLDDVLAPRLQAVQTPGLGRCAGRRRTGCLWTNAAGIGVLPPVMVGAPAVDVTAEGTAGPYDYVVLEGISSGAVVDYLVEEGFDLDPGLEDVLAPYVGSGGRFLAVRLQKDRTTGEIAPLGFRYPGDEASVPIRLTALASAPQLPVEVTIFGASRAVPTNYLHVELDQADLAWTSGGQNYYDIVARAVEEAGGQAFVTDFSGPADGFDPVWDEARQDAVDALYDAPNATLWASGFEALGFPDDPALRYAFDGFADLSLPGRLVQKLEPDVDLGDLMLQLEDRLFVPRRRAGAVLEHPYVTRLSTTLAPAEMTVDPVFALSSDLPDVPALREAEGFLDCRGGRSEPYVRLSDGRVLQANLPPEAPYALRIEQLFSEGPPEVLLDNRDLLNDQAAGIDGELTGCSSASGGGAGLLVLLAVAGVWRRRR
jgi:MYXO-CTERM domain-containing protein